MPKPVDPPKPEVGFPALEWEDEQEQFTRPMPMHERPFQSRVDVQIAVVAAHYGRIAKDIDAFWGHRDCIPYIQALILNGYKEGQSRMGFKPEVVTAMLNLVELHKEAFGE